MKTLAALQNGVQVSTPGLGPSTCRILIQSRQRWCCLTRVQNGTSPASCLFCARPLAAFRVSLAPRLCN
eukprot:228143-Chlamydomonas_euryale.AAC.7